MMNLQGVRFLLTQNDLYSINGSAVITLELAQYLRGQGATVQVYTYFLHDPLKTIFEENNIDVTDDGDSLSMDDFDYIWVHQQVLPLGIISELEFIHEKDPLPIFIFNHMSPLSYIADEFPYIWGLEDNLSSLSLFHSPFTMELQLSMLSDSVSKKLYANPAPSEFSRSQRLNSDEVRNVLVVSNHPPEEIIDIKSKFKHVGIEVTLLGENLDSYSLVSLDMLEKYDVVITIGKTVQNCLVSGTPVYVYDHFGGPGYLNDSNYRLAEHRNFSRGFDKKTAEDIFREITDNYSAARKFIETRRSEFIEKFTIERVITNLLSSIAPRDYEKLDGKYLSYLFYAHNYSREHRIAARQRMVYKHELDNVRIELEACRVELDAIKLSKSYKLGNKIAAPLRKLKTMKEDA